MPTPQSDIEILATQEYKYGFVSDIESDDAPPGLTEDTFVSFRPEKRARVAARMAPQGLPALAHHDRADMAQRPLPAHRLPGFDLLFRPKKKKAGATTAEEIDPELLRTYENWAFRSRSASCWRASPLTRCLTVSRSRRTFKEKLKSMGIIFGSFSDAVQEHPELVKKYLGSVVPYTDNFFATLNSAVFSDGSFCYVPRASVVHGAFHLLPHQRQEYRPV